MDELFEKVYTPDVLLCLANLSSDEIFTPPNVANQVLDMLPQDLFSDPNTTFLDPACKSGVFLREIAKRLIVGLQDEIPDLQERLDHIYHKQLYGIAITELTSLLSRRSLYCSKYPNGPFSISKFDNIEGNIRYKNIKHTWVKGKCAFCGISENNILAEKNRGESLEAYAYEWIHTLKPEEIFNNMKFDVIASNPPYATEDSGWSVSAKPIYQYFVEKAIRLNPKYITMIIPSRWFAGGKGLDSFRSKMLNDNRLRKIVDFINAKDCFPDNSISGGVNYFLWDRDHPGSCEFTTVLNGKCDTAYRNLDEYEVFVRYNKAVEILHKVDFSSNLISVLSSRNPFGLPTSVRGEDSYFDGALTVISSKGKGFVSVEDITANNDAINKYKVMISRITYEHAGEPDKDGTLRVLSKVQILEPNEVCTDSYIIGGPFDSKEQAENFVSYLMCKFTRFLILQTLSSINLSKERFMFVPIQDFSKSWTDEELYAKYNLATDEIDFIESMIKPMNLTGSDT